MVLSSISVLTMALALSGPEGSLESKMPAPLVLEQCNVTLIREHQVPAEDPGVIDRILVKPGESVSAGQLLVQLKDNQAQVAKKAAMLKRDAAKAQAESEVDKNYASAAFAVAEKEYQQALDTNQRKQNAVPALEVERLKLAMKRAYFSWEKAVHDQKVAAMNAEAEGAEVDAAELAIKRRQINSRISGVVTDIKKQEGEWVSAGDIIIRIIQMDKFYVKGDFDIRVHAPETLQNANVEVSVQLAAGTKKFNGKVVYISPVIGVANLCEVWAEVENRQENQHWLLRDAMFAVMSIDLKPEVGSKDPGLVSADVDSLSNF